MNDEKLLLENQLCHRIYMLNNAMTRAYRPLLKSLDITYPQYVVLMALWEKDDLEINTLQQITHIDGGALTLILKKLVNKQMIQLQPSQQDKRIKHVLLTQEGITLKETASELPEKIRCSVPSITEDEAIQLKIILDKMNRDLLNN